jgi:hypothetical protein
MKKALRILAIVLMCSLCATVALAETAEITDAVVINKYPVLTGDEMKRVLFKASMPENISPRGVNWELHNPFRDKVIAGFIVTVEYKPTGADKPVSLDLFIRTACGPLQSADGQQGCYNAEEAMKSSPVIKLKEVHYAPEGA